MVSAQQQQQWHCTTAPLPPAVPNTTFDKAISDVKMKVDAIAWLSEQRISYNQACNAVFAHTLWKGLVILRFTSNKGLRTPDFFVLPFHARFVVE